MSIQELELKAFLPKIASEAEYNDVIALQLVSFQERNPGDKLPPVEVMRKQLEVMQDNPMFSTEVWLAYHAEGRLDGMLMMGFPRPESPDYEAQKHMGMASIYVHPEARKKGLGTLLLRKIVESFEANAISLIQGDVSSDEGRAFASYFGGTVALETKTSRVYTAEMDWAMIQAWADEGESANPTVKLEFYAGLPDDKDLEAYCRVITELNGQQPLGELEGVESTFTPENMKQMQAQQKERGVQEFVMISREADGAISGLSEIMYNPKRPHLVQQGLTGVQEAYRGRNLGKWLKAALLLYIRQTYPDVQYIDTTNATVNAAMLSINERIGFKLHRHNSLFKLQVAEAAKRL